MTEGWRLGRTRDGGGRRRRRSWTAPFAWHFGDQLLALPRATRRRVDEARGRADADHVLNAHRSRELHGASRSMSSATSCSSRPGPRRARRRAGCGSAASTRSVDSGGRARGPVLERQRARGGRRRSCASSPPRPRCSRAARAERARASRRRDPARKRRRSSWPAPRKPRGTMRRRPGSAHGCLLRYYAQHAALGRGASAPRGARRDLWATAPGLALIRTIYLQQSRRNEELRLRAPCGRPPSSRRRRGTRITGWRRSSCSTRSGLNQGNEMLELLDRDPSRLHETGRDPRRRARVGPAPARRALQPEPARSSCSRRDGWPR